MDRTELTKLAQSIAGKTFPTDDTVTVRADALAELLRVYRAVQDAPAASVGRDAGVPVIVARGFTYGQRVRLVREGTQDKGS